jgi:hypothetical protein
MKMEMLYDVADGERVHVLGSEGSLLGAHDSRGEWAKR